MIVILGSFQGVRPIVISDDEGEPHVFASMDEAREFTCSEHIGLMACSSIVIVNIETGEVETF
jgi:hypothetical protein